MSYYATVRKLTGPRPVCPVFSSGRSTKANYAEIISEALETTVDKRPGKESFSLSEVEKAVALRDGESHAGYVRQSPGNGESSYCGDPESARPDRSHLR